MAKNNKNLKVETKVETNSVTEEKKIKTAVTPNMVNNNSIIEVVLNGLSLLEAVTVAKTQLQKADNSIFNVALTCAYMKGIEIPPYIDIRGEAHGSAKIDSKGTPQKELAKLVGRSEPMISGYIKAMKKVIEAGLFDIFAKGEISFQTDKINIMFDDTGKLHDNLSMFPIFEIFNMSTNTIEGIIKSTTSATEENAESAETTSATEEIEYTTIEFDGKKWEVPQKAFELWLFQNAKAIN